MSIETYKKAKKYENFMCRAFQTTYKRKSGVDISYMKNLIDAENGESWVNHLPSANQQFEVVQLYIYKAFEKLITRCKTDEGKRLLMILQEKVNNSSSSSELLTIIEQALQLTQDLK